MVCGTTTYLGFYGIMGVLLALYSIHFAKKEPEFFFNIGLFPLGVMAISELNILDACTTNVLGIGSAALLLLGFATLAFGEYDELA